MASGRPTNGRGPQSTLPPRAATSRTGAAGPAVVDPAPVAVPPRVEPVASGEHLAAGRGEPLVDSPGPRRRAVPRQRRIVGAVATGAVLGAALGAVAAVALTEYRSAALVDLSSAMSVTAGSSLSTDQADRFLQSELLYLNSASFARSVGQATGASDEVQLTAAQVGNTNVVQVAATAGQAADAQTLADTAVSAYAAHRRSVLTQDVSAQQTQLTAARSDLAAAQSEGADTSAAQERVTTLQSQIDDAQAMADAQGVGGSVVETAADSGAERTRSPLVDGGAGLALGALLGLLVVAVPHALSRRVWTADDVRAAGLPLTQPALPGAPSNWVGRLADRGSDDPLESASRLVAARLAAAVTDGRPLVLVGATAGVGTSYAAVNVAAALARRRRVVLISAGDVSDGKVAGWFDVADADRGLLSAGPEATLADVERVLRPTAVPGLALLTVGQAARWEPVEQALAGRTVPLLLEAGWLVVVDCPPLDVSSAALELGPLAPATIVVVARGRTRDEQLAGLAEDFRIAQVPATSALLVEAASGRPRRASSAV